MVLVDFGVDGLAQPGDPHQDEDPQVDPELLLGDGLSVQGPTLRLRACLKFRSKQKNVDLSFSSSSLFLVLILFLHSTDEANRDLSIHEERVLGETFLWPFIYGPKRE